MEATSAAAASRPVVEPLGDLEDLCVEEEHLLEVLLQPACSVDIGLERRVEPGVGADVAPTGPVMELRFQGVGDARL